MIRSSSPLSWLAALVARALGTDEPLLPLTSPKQAGSPTGDSPAKEAFALTSKTIWTTEVLTTNTERFVINVGTGCQ